MIRRLAFALTLLFLTLGALPRLVTHAAAPTTITVDLVPKLTSTQGPIVNSGEALPALDALPSADATFQAYDITALFNQTRQSTSNVAALLTISHHWDDLRTSGQPVGAPVSTGDDGIVRFATLPTQSDGLYRVYLFEQTVVAAGQQKAVPTILGLPLEATPLQSQYRLYPKVGTMTAELQVAGLEPLTAGQLTSVPAGLKIEAIARLTLPGDLDAQGDGQWHYRQLAFDLRADAGLRIIPDSMRLSVDGQALTVPLTAQTLDAQTHRLTIDPSMTAAWRQLTEQAGQPLTLHYTVIVVPDALAYQDLTTTFMAHFQLGTDTTTLTATSGAVESGGAVVTTIDAFDQRPLADAQYLLSRAADDGTVYAQRTATGFQWVTEPVTATTFTSDQAGQLTLAGLAAGTYQLQQTHAPGGYVRRQAPTPVTIAVATPGPAALTRLTIRQAPATGVPPATGSLAAGALVILGLAFTSAGLARAGQRRKHAAA
ncbi:pilin N-terminal domain-containing protein [Lacticaseibacillus absianus]|uniref:pilin N-terminal domain-containing protein n=1 Tax=Lacticaseibacillus absianus TaxID=2729623 RepID=UPI0015CCE21B|nr:SpaA isopeptide-forming pilin-related protein [Lacticaseibacillus absianus]